MAKGGKQLTRPGYRKLVVICDRNASSEVKSGKNVKSVPLRFLPLSKALLFPPVRRNKKIQKVLRMGKGKTEQHIKLQLVTSRKGTFSDLDCVYGKQVIDVLQRPLEFVHKRDKTIKRAWVYNVTQGKSSAVIMQSDTHKREMDAMNVDVERDIGVLKESVRQLLAEKTHDVIAINTHPGHHAGPTTVAGFCVINNIAFAVALIKRSQPHLKIGVIDIDVHPGDGTFQFVKRGLKGLVKNYTSIHSTVRFNNMRSDLGENGIALKKDRYDQVASRRLIDKIEEVLTTWNRARLDIVIVAVGYDTLKKDKYANLGFQMLPPDFHEVGKVLAERREQIFFVQEGGYNLNETADAFDYLTKGFREGRKEQMRAS